MNNKRWKFREDMLGHYINNISSKTFQDAENRLNFLEEKNNMDKYLKVIEARIQSYKEALELNERFIRTDVDREMDQSTFEKNMIGLLMTRVELKERIDELEYVVKLLSMEIPEE